MSYKYGIRQSSFSGKRLVVKIAIPRTAQNYEGNITKRPCETQNFFNSSISIETASVNHKFFIQWQTQFSAQRSPATFAREHPYVDSIMENRRFFSWNPQTNPVFTQALTDRDELLHAKVAGIPRDTICPDPVPDGIRMNDCIVGLIDCWHVVPDQEKQECRISDVANVCFRLTQEFPDSQHAADHAHSVRDPICRVPNYVERNPFPQTVLCYAAQMLTRTGIARQGEGDMMAKTGKCMAHVQDLYHVGLCAFQHIGANIQNSQSVLVTHKVSCQPQS
jgi:hypothetical protein